jgi:acetyltransferase-like isoleucine patch superfamily enzyme
VKCRTVLAVVLALLPPRAHRWLGCRLLGWDVAPNAYVGHSIILTKRLVMAPHSAIGHFNVFRGLEEVTLDEHAAVGFFNWITGPSLESGAFPNSPSRRPALKLGKYSMILHRHLIDCSDTVSLGDFANLGGYRSTVITHGVDLVRHRSFAAAVTIGERSAVMSNCVVLAGTTVPPRSIVAAGSVVSGKLAKELTFYRGNPAEAVRELSPDFKFFSRSGTTP